MSKFKQLSCWAKEHTWPSRFIIVFSFIIMNVLGIVTGLLLNDLDLVFPGWFIVLSVLTFGIAWLKYPGKKQLADKIERNRVYVFRKTCDTVLIGTTFMMFVYFGNRQVTPLNTIVFPASAVNSFPLPKDTTKAYKSPEEFRKSLKDESGKPLKLTERKKLLKQQLKAIKKDKTTSEAGKVVLIILCVLLALVLAYGVAALSCSLSCSGSEGAAVVVALLGLTGIILLTFFLIRAILRGSKKEKARRGKQENPPAGN
jgi:hypothetical protein